MSLRNAIGYAQVSVGHSASRVLLRKKESCSEVVKEL